MSVPTTKCDLHLCDSTSSDSELKHFENDTWQKIKTAEKLEKTLFSESKYFSIKLPEKYDDTMGYHRQCYKNFTALPKVPG